MLETIIISLLFCKIKGYKVKGLFKHWTIYPVLILESIYIIAQISIFMNNYFMLDYAAILKVIYLCSYLPLIFYYDIHTSYYGITICISWRPIK